MKTHKLPYKLDTKQLCQESSNEGRLVDGKIKISELPNLSGLLADNSGEVQATLRCGKDQEGLPFILGDLQVSLNLTCERCLNKMVYPLKAEFKVSPVETETQANNLPKRYEPVMVTESILSLTDWLSEEILLNLPLAPKHETSFCHAVVDNSPKIEAITPKKPSPFEALKNLKTS